MDELQSKAMVEANNSLTFQAVHKSLNHEAKSLKDLVSFFDRVHADSIPWELEMVLAHDLLAG